MGVGLVGWEWETLRVREPSLPLLSPLPGPDPAVPPFHHPLQAEHPKSGWGVCAGAAAAAFGDNFHILFLSPPSPLEPYREASATSSPGTTGLVLVL